MKYSVLLVCETHSIILHTGNLPDIVDAFLPLGEEWFPYIAVRLGKVGKVGETIPHKDWKEYDGGNRCEFCGGPATTTTDNGQPVCGLCDCYMCELCGLTAAELDDDNRCATCAAEKGEEE